MDDPMIIIKELEKRLGTFGEIIGYGKWGIRNIFLNDRSIIKQMVHTELH